MQIYTNFESNSQQNRRCCVHVPDCFRCKFTQILKAIHNYKLSNPTRKCIVSDANLHKFWKQFTTRAELWRLRPGLFPMQIYTNFESNSQQFLALSLFWLHCFRCKFTQILKAIHNFLYVLSHCVFIVSDANLHKFWKQFTTFGECKLNCVRLFPMQIYTNFESNSQQSHPSSSRASYCFRCKFTQILKAIHNLSWTSRWCARIVSDANLHKFWKQFTTCLSRWNQSPELFPMQIYTNFESNSQLYGCQ